MSTKRFFYVMSASLTVLLLLVIAATAGGNLILQKQSDKLTLLKINEKAIEQQKVLLLQAKKDIQKYNELDLLAKTIVPHDKDQAKTVREITTIATQNSIPIQSIDFPASTLGTTPPKSASPNEEGSTPAVPSAPSITQVKPVSGISGIYTLEIQVTSDGEVPYKNLVGFLEGLENNRRTAHVTKINLDPSKDGNGIKFNITLNAYLKP